MVTFTMAVIVWSFLVGFVAGGALMWGLWQSAHRSARYWRKQADQWHWKYVEIKVRGIMAGHGLETGLVVPDGWYDDVLAVVMGEAPVADDQQDALHDEAVREDWPEARRPEVGGLEVGP
jgi:hypothetical protein